MNGTINQNRFATTRAIESWTNLRAKLKRKNESD